MSTIEPDEAFFEIANRFIQAANTETESANLGRVSSALLYAAARLNAFAVSCSAQSAAQLEEDKEGAVKYFLDQYEKMLRHNLNDYIEHYDHYAGKA